MDDKPSPAATVAAAEHFRKSRRFVMGLGVWGFRESPTHKQGSPAEPPW
jgi:hypothetical protein